MNEHEHKAKDEPATKPTQEEVAKKPYAIEVSFQPTEEIANQTDPFLPVGWFWRAGASTPLAVCEMVWEERPGDAERYANIRCQEETSVALHLLGRLHYTGKDRLMIRDQRIVFAYDVSHLENGQLAKGSEMYRDILNLSTVKEEL